MKQATIFNRASGEIIRWGDFDDNDLTITTVPGEDFVVGIFDGHKYFVDTQTNEAKLIPPSPTPHHVFKCTTKQWEDPRTPETEWPLVRQQRDALLAKSDWTQLPDVPLATKDAWATYRQALRDITLQPDPFNIDWPTVPI
jgi:hypothetical protein